MTPGSPPETVNMSADLPPEKQLSLEHTPGRNRLVPAVLLAGLIVIACALRFWRLGDWGFDTDEIFMLRDSINLRPSNPRPLLYLLNFYLVRPLMPLDEFGLRLLPAVFGVLAIPAFYLMGRRLVGTRAALFGALLLAFSPVHVFYSQFGRYLSLVFLLSTVYPFAIYLGLRDGNRSLLALGLVTGVLAVLAHPASILLLGGLGIWIIAVYLKRDRLVQLWSQRSVRWGALLVVILAVVIALRFIPMLQHWILEHDTAPPGGKREFLLNVPRGPGMKPLSLLLSYVENLTLPLVLAGVLGIYLLWQGPARSLALLLASLFLFPITFILAVQTRTAVSTFYLIPAIPALFLGAGVFLDRLAGLDSGLRPRWLLSATVAVMILAAGAPTLVSQYRDGRRYDFRGAARWLDERLTPEDVVFSDQAKVVAHYIPGTQVQPLLGDTAPLTQSIRLLHQSGRGGGALWIVSPARSHAFRTNKNIGNLNRWIYDNCQLRNTIGVSRVDFRQNFLQVYRCVPPAPVAVVRPGRAPAPPEARP
jgi:mannosyltransferase